MRIHIFVIALLTALVQSSAVFGHASLVRAEPADGALVAEPPVLMRLTFNEPVTPLVIRLIAPDGAATTVAASAENTTVTVKLPALVRGTHVLSWRVISADGHPVGGSLVFSVGEASAPPGPGALPAGDPLVRAALWMAKVIIYLALMIGIGGAFFRMWFDVPSAHTRPRVAPSTHPGTGSRENPESLVPGPRLREDERASQAWIDRALIGLIAAGLLVTPLSVGLQGLDALDLRLPALAQRLVWETSLGTSYGMTAITAMIALFAGLFAFEAESRTNGHSMAGALSLAALMATGLALALSGHTSNASPQMLTRPSVFVHVICVAFWVGALLPLVAAVQAGEGNALGRFSHAIPYPLAGLVISGIVLAVVQLDRVDALWTTSYGIVLSCKIAAVVALLALAALNRYVFTPRYQHGNVAASGSLTKTLTVELCLVAAILALVALWRFTPPPRALAAFEPVEVHLHGTRAMAQVSLMPVRARDPRVRVEVLDGEFNVLPVKEVTMTLANPAAGIEPVRRAAVHDRDGHWRVAGLRIPVSGQWIVRVDLLIDDFDKIVLEDQVDLPRLP
ncbi:MAG: copper resistance protein CopC [Rhizobiales bacterium]|nr:copper resistance protein CopC [Hyphomicrobiales bacterium]